MRTVTATQDRVDCDAAAKQTIVNVVCCCHDSTFIFMAHHQRRCPIRHPAEVPLKLGTADPDRTDFDQDLAAPDSRLEHL